MKALLDDLAARTDRTAKGDPSLSMNIRDAIVSDMFSDAPDTLGILVVTQPSRIEVGTTVVYPMVSVVTRVYLQKKILYLSVYSPLASQADVEWVRSASHQLVTATGKLY